MMTGRQQLHGALTAPSDRKWLITLCFLPGMLLAQQPQNARELLAGLERGASKFEWTECKGEPPWLVKPEAVADMLSFATIGVHRSAQQACHEMAANADGHVRDVLFEHLQPVFGDQGALPILETMLRHVQRVNAVVGTTTIMPGSAEEQLVHAACIGWRMPIRKVVSSFEPSQQGRIEWVLLRDMVHWQRVAAAPKWTQQLPVRDGYFRCAFASPGRVPKDAQLAAIASGRNSVRSHLLELLQPVAGPLHAAKAVDEALQRLAPVAKVLEDQREAPVPKDLAAIKRGPKCTAYCLWEVPTGPLLQALPKVDRAAAAAVLRN